MLPTRRFGFEIEVYNVTNKAQLMRNLPGFTKVYDSSIRGVKNMELVSPILSGENGLELAREAINKLNQQNAKVNNSCGFHVHIDMVGATLESFKRIFKRFIKFEPVFKKLIADNRINNTFCKPNSKLFTSTEEAFTKINEAKSLFDLSALVNQNNRYYMLNLQSFWKHGTIEFRLKEATLDADEVVNWITMLLIWVEDSIEINTRLGKADSKFASLCDMAVAPKNYAQLNEKHRRQVLHYIRYKVKEKGLAS
jgi:hypothetical protein